MVVKIQVFWWVVIQGSTAVGHECFGGPTLHSVTTQRP